MEKAVRLQRLTRNRDEADVKVLLYSRKTSLCYGDSACVLSYRRHRDEEPVVSLVDETS